MAKTVSKKEGDPERNESNSTLWQHSKLIHNGEMKTSDWKTRITSSHITALNRQITEATIISNEGVDSLLNSKNEFGANNLPELVLQHGTRIEGAAKRRRQAQGNSDDHPSNDSNQPQNNQPMRKGRKMSEQLPEESSSQIYIKEV